MKWPKVGQGVFWPLAVGLVAVSVFGLLLAQGTQNSASTGVNPVPLVTPLPSPPAVEAPLATATELTTLPATETSWNEATQSAQETESYVATVLADRQSVLATAYQRQTDQPIAQGTQPFGILEGGWDVFRYPSQDVIIQNLWRNVVNENGDWMSVYAGSMYTEPTQGLVIVSGQAPDQTYLTPTKAGALRIVAEQNLRLTLVSTDGTTFYFDILGQRFVDSLTELAPTVTPYLSGTLTPTETPAPTVTLAPTCTPGPPDPSADITPLPITCN